MIEETTLAALRSNVKLECGQDVIWLQKCSWGGKAKIPAKFMKYSGQISATIECFGLKKRVRLMHLRSNVKVSARCWAVRLDRQVRGWRHD
jgi:hypothetical protein